ncbi:MAG: hypothetical protein FWG87_10545 [Defluviitaleaceae bacterium]|nr:hypothetical protein [Defluviitaleaceae bacterium]
MKDENKATPEVINEEQLGEISGGSGRSGASPGGFDSGGYVKPDPQCIYKTTPDSVTKNWPEQTFIEDGVEVRRVKCQSTNFCFSCKCKDTTNCKDTWHRLYVCWLS